MVNNFICQCEWSRWHSMKSVTPNTGKFRWGNGNPYSSCLHVWAQHKMSHSMLSLVHMALGPGVPTKLQILVHTAPPCLQPGLRQQLAHGAASHAISLGCLSKDCADIPEVWFWQQQGTEAVLQSPFHLSGALQAVPGVQCYRCEQTAIPPCRASSCFFRQSRTESAMWLVQGHPEWALGLGQDPCLLAPELKGGLGLFLRTRPSFL